jgi:23S rRNA (uridine2552-2'-O)-methyltransferase
MAAKRELHDRFFKQAKADGYAARSAYKLLEIQKKRQIIRPGDRVADLGCSPGSWVQVASELAGPRGLVVGIDLKPVAIPLPGNAHTVVADVFKVTAEDLLALTEPGSAGGGRGRGPRLFNVVLSDMAPNTEGGGGGTVDHFRSIELCRRVLALLPRMLVPRGHCVMKAFEGEEYPALLKETQRLFSEVKGFKPESSRDVSREMFVIATGFRPPAEGPAGMPPADKHAIAAPAPKPGPGWGRN